MYYHPIVSLFLSLPPLQQYGNLEHVFSYEHLDSIFFIENSVIKLQTIDVLHSAYEQQYIPLDLFEQCRAMHRFKRVHDLTTWKNVGKNECRLCRQPYAVLANGAVPCTAQEAAGGKHQPAFDFELDDDVLKCQLVRTKHTHTRTNRADSRARPMIGRMTHVDLVCLHLLSLSLSLACRLSNTRTSLVSFVRYSSPSYSTRSHIELFLISLCVEN